MADVDVLILGGGTGGYEAAIRAAELGMRTVVVEKDKLGGTCLHRGCIPSKALLRTAEVMALAKDAAAYGVDVSAPRLNYTRAHERKDAIVAQLHRGVEGLVKRAGVRVVNGTGSLLPPSIFAPAGAVSVATPDGEHELISPETVIVATGSVPRPLPGLPFDGKLVVNSDHTLEMKELPRSVIIVGAGAIGCEWASLYSDLGVQVTMVEMAGRILPLEDAEIARVVDRALAGRGVRILTGAGVDPASFEEREGQATIEVTDAKGKGERLAASLLLVAIGRAPVVEGFGLENFTKVQVAKGAIVTDDHCRTGDPNVYAIGDVIGHLQLAHVAVHEGITAVETAKGLNPEGVDYSKMPRCTYTRPEVGSVGLSEEEAKAAGHEVKVGKFFMKANGKALIHGDADGLAKIVTDARTGDVLGVHVVGPHATDVVQEGVFARELAATGFDLALTNHPHPTIVEILNDAALAAEGRTA